MEGGDHVIGSMREGVEVIAATVAVLLIVAVFAAVLFHLCDLLDDDEFPEDWQ